MGCLVLYPWTEKNKFVYNLSINNTMPPEVHTSNIILGLVVDGISDVGEHVIKVNSVI